MDSACNWKSDFDAYPLGPDDSYGFEVVGRELIVTGAKFDTVLDQPGEYYFQQWRLRQCIREGVHTPTGQTWPEAVFRAMSTGQCPREIEPAKYQQSVRRWYLWQVAKNTTLKSNGKNEAEYKRLLDKAQEMGLNDWMPSWAEVENWDGDPWEGDRSVTALYRIGSTFGFRRRLFLTEKGNLGHSTLETAPGDEVWLLKGARVPFVLRPVEGTDTYQIVGETYLHGYMHGEMLTDDVKARLGPTRIV
jgi:hypothetical protein